MALTFDPTFENTALKNQSLMLEIEGLKRFITPDDELLDGHDMIGYRLEREKASIQEIAQTINNETYKQNGNTEEENAHIKEELLAQIKNHQDDIDKLEKQREEIPKAIARLERLKEAKPREMGVLKLPAGTDRKEIRHLIKEIETRLIESHSQDEKRFLTYLQGQLETAKTVLDTGKELGDVYLFLHESEFKHVAKIKGLKDVHIDMTVQMLENIANDLRQEQERLRQNGSALHQHFAQPISKIEERLVEIRRNPESVTDKRKMLETTTVVDKLSMDLQAEKMVAPSFKDKLRNFVNGFRSFLNNAFGIQTSEVESLKSKTLTNMFNIQQEMTKVAKLASQAKSAPERDNPKPRL